MVYYLFDNTGKNLDIYHYAHIYCHTHLKKYSVLFGLTIYEIIHVIQCSRWKIWGAIRLNINDTAH